MSLKELIEDFNNNVKPQLTEILALLKKNADNDVKSNIEAAAAAKIITELKTTIQDYQNDKAIGKQSKASKENRLVLTPEQGNKDKGKSRYRYSYPNHDVGNEELGTGKNPNSMTWPFGSISNKKI